MGSLTRFKRGWESKNNKTYSQQTVTSHGGHFILGLLQVLVGEIQVELELDLLLLEGNILGPKFTRLLQSTTRQISRRIQRLVTFEQKRASSDCYGKRVLRLPPNLTIDSSLGDYTQWVHLACPHWFDFPLGVGCPA